MGLLKARDAGAQVLNIWMDMPETAILLKQWKDFKLKILPIGFMAAAEQPGFWNVSKGAAQYRKSAAELVQRVPEVVETIRDGRVCLSVVVELARVLTPALLLLAPAPTAPAQARHAENGVSSSVVYVQVFRSAKRAGTFAKMQVGGVVLTTALSVAFVWVGRMGAAGILSGVALGWLIMLVPMLRGIAAEGSLSPRHVSRSMLSEFLTFGLPLIPAGVSAWALVLIDRFVIQAFGHAADVGLYSVAYSLGDRIMQMVTMPLLLTMSPSLIETFERKGQPLAEKVQTQFIRYFALATFPLIAGMAVAAKPFMHVFTRRSSRQSRTPDDPFKIGSDLWRGCPRRSLRA